MSDIATRLRRWTHAVDAVPASDLMDEAADEIERLRTAIRRLAEQDATLSVCNGNVTVTMDCPYVTGTVTRYCTLTPFTLTDEEREAIEEAMRQVVESDCIATPHALEVIDTLRGLLERTQEQP